MSIQLAIIKVNGKKFTTNLLDVPQIEESQHWIEIISRDRRTGEFADLLIEGEFLDCIPSRDIRYEILVEISSNDLREKFPDIVIRPVDDNLLPIFRKVLKLNEIIPKSCKCIVVSCLYKKKKRETYCEYTNKNVIATHNTNPSRHF